jgi:hypothetical protein
MKKSPVGATGPVSMPLQTERRSSPDGKNPSLFHARCTTFFGVGLLCGHRLLQLAFQAAASAQVSKYFEHFLDFVVLFFAVGRRARAE